MLADNFKLDDYLKRIGFVGEARADLATLTQLMQRQLRTLPFENLDVQAGKIISIVPEDIVAKLVHGGRGGYCYEVNSLFSMALTAIGITHTILGARPFVPGVRKARSHMIVSAHIDGQDWLCDTGYGLLSMRQPFNLAVMDTEIGQDYDRYRLGIGEDGDYWMQGLITGNDANWGPLYSFNLSPFELADFIPCNYYNSTHPDAIFVQKLLIVRHTDSGRHVLLGNSLKSFEDGRMTLRTLAPEDIKPTVRDLFGLEM